MNLRSQDGAQRPIVIAIRLLGSKACRLQPGRQSIKHWLSKARGLSDYIVNDTSQREGPLGATFGLMQFDDPQIEWPAGWRIKLVLRRDRNKRFAAAAHRLAFDRCVRKPEVVDTADWSDPCLQRAEQADPRRHHIAECQKLGKQPLLLLYAEPTAAAAKEMVPTPGSCNGDRNGVDFHPELSRLDG